MKAIVSHCNQDTCESLAAALSDAGYEVVSCKSSDDIFGAFDGEEMTPSVALLDWQLPEFDGSQLCQMIRTNINEPVYIIAIAPEQQRHSP